MTTKPTISKAELRAALEKLEVPKMVVWIDGETKVETTHLVEKTIDEIIALIADQQRQLLDRLLEQKEEACLDSMTDIVEFIRVQVIKDIREGLGR